MSKKRYAYNSLCPRREAQQKRTEREFTSSVSGLKPLIINSDNLRLLFTKWSHRRADRLFLYRTKYGTSPSSQARNLIRNTVVVEDLIGNQPLGYRFLFCKTPPTPIITPAEMSCSIIRMCTISISVEYTFLWSAKLWEQPITLVSFTDTGILLASKEISFFRDSYNISYHCLIVKKNRNKCSYGKVKNKRMLIKNNIMNDGGGG